MWGINLNWVVKMAVYRLLDYALNYGLAVQFDRLHTAPFIFIEVKVEQVALFDVIVVQIFGELLLALCVVLIAVPDLQLDDILLSDIDLRAA